MIVKLQSMQKFTCPILLKKQRDSFLQKVFSQILIKLISICDIFLARIKAKSDKSNVKSNLAMFVIVRHFASIVRKTNRDTEKKPFILCDLPQNTHCMLILYEQYFFHYMTNQISITIDFIFYPILCHIFSTLQDYKMILWKAAEDIQGKYKNTFEISIWIYSYQLILDVRKQIIYILDYE